MNEVGNVRIARNRRNARTGVSDTCSTWVTLVTDTRTHAFKEWCERAVQIIIRSKRIKSRRYSTALRMPEHDDELDAKMLSCIYATGKLHIAYNVAGNSYAEQLAEARHEYMLGHHSRIGTGHDARIGSLPVFRELLYSRRRYIAGISAGFYISSITRLQAL